MTSPSTKVIPTWNDNRVHSPRLILDMDFGIDDSMAALYLDSTGLVEIVAIGTVHGNTTARSAANNAAQVTRALGREDIPIAIGAMTPIAQALHVADEVHGEDGIGGTADTVDNSSRISSDTAAEQLIRLARSEPGAFSLLATGPLTNLALAVMVEPRLPTLLRSVVIMGGAVRVPGNITSLAEANVWHDPEAAALVFATFPNITLVPLDLTQREWVGTEGLDRIATAPPGKLRDLVRRMLDQYQAFTFAETGQVGFPLHDPSAAVLVVHPHLARYETAQIQVETAGRYSRGMLVVDDRPHPISADLPHVSVAVEKISGSVVDEFLDVAFGSKGVPK